MEAGPIPLAHLSMNVLDIQDATYSMLGLAKTLEWTGHLIHINIYFMNGIFFLTFHVFYSIVSGEFVVDL